MATYTIGDIFLVQGQRVDLPASVGAMFGFQRAPEITSTPFAAAPSTAPTLNKHTGLAGGVVTLAPDAACKGLAARAAKYGAADPQPQIRRILLEKCEAYQRSLGSGVRADAPTGYPEPAPEMDPKVKIAIGAGALLAIGVVAFKVLK